MNYLSEQVIEIEKSVSRLSREEQLWLVDRIIQNVKLNESTEHSHQQVKYLSSITPKIIEKELEKMANDPAMIREIEMINQEFLSTEMDGLVES